MDKKFWISGIVAAVLFYLLGFVVHGVILLEDYSKLPNLLRSEEEAMSRMAYMIIANLLMGFAFSWIYRQGVTASASWVQQGTRYGIAIALLMVIPWYLIYYTVQPWPGMVVVKQIVLETISVIIIALAVAFIQKPSVQAATA
jgi:hypothetical protein